MNMISLMQFTFSKVIETFSHNWFLLVISILLSAALAFLMTGAGTSFGALGGMLTIARWHVIAIVIGILWAGSILIGFVYNLFLL
jgi:hypothetical protein